MKVEDQHILVALKQAGTIRQASKDLLVSQPALSQRLKLIEEQWGEKIFIRSHKHLTVTPAGEIILQFAEKILDEEKTAKEHISRSSSIVTGTLSLGVSSLVGQYVLPQVLEAFIKAYPHVKIELQTGLSDHFRDSAQPFHVTIVRGQPNDQQHYEELFQDQLYLVERKEQTAQTSKPLIEFQADDTFQTMVKEWFLNNSHYSFTQKIKVDQIETCKQLMSHGIGMAILPQIAIQDLPFEEFTFHPLMLENEPLTRSTWICTTEAAQQLPQVQAFLDIMKVQIS